MADTRTDPRTGLLDRHAEALRLFGERVHAIRDDQWDAPTPCADWTVRDLVNHVTGEQRWVLPLLDEGLTVADVGDALDGDLLGDDPVAAWDTAATAARAAFTAPGALDRPVALSAGPTPGSAYCRELTCDCTVHTWDLSRAIGADERLPQALVELATEVVTPYAGDLAASGMFAPPVEVPADADAQTRLLGLTGRKA
ncbi:TIGR03086 family metal-binding protein [Streptomyces antimicrobicus]|uniref:TIGR03086 family protein n=1 Tax=Streptomyces antimicrobicus TaxID=2883108 RepID=A0ABS8B942_9ACTN|nr:TIGR03086 family metal-binding protein [Streptomyces antimicrobicus]MCB5181137.1 TIGR03086 family protein [Streptomyces antimicrobicus]